MIIEVKVPTPGESITEVELSNWLVADGDLVRKDQELAEVESDKATLSLIAPESGKITFLIQAGQTVKVNSIACTIDTSVEVPDAPAAPAPQPASKPAAPVDQAKPASVASASTTKDQADPVTSSKGEDVKIRTTPLARSMMAAENLSADEVLKGLKRLSSKEVGLILALREGRLDAVSVAQSTERTEERKAMTQLRKQLSKRLVKVKNETAMLTTFNEVDMSALMDLRKSYQDAFVKKHGFKIGLNSFFLKAAAQALMKFPVINSIIDGDDIITPSYVDISVAMQSPKGLLVPVIRNVHAKSLAEIERDMQEMAEKARSAKVSLEEMSGGTFTITNGGTYGSMMSTPLINPPQSAILGMHNIVDRPVAVKGQIVIRPMMYVALSYDHRLIDGKDSVSFLVEVKKLIENPVSLVFGGKNPEEALLGL
ncbi:MAG: 2-oxoglutarate dehydrogenase complex dihydrolipoyllysine-residue succinyltransferase [Bacteroidota bacterium]|jgi:2-oxoglutarate dehydrogenase E2 component (dihydrolipoamide succinyltransferase)|nr:2-oxoglutarate dehydrogenase complex dihydrolipoyllysine-residue succinyltransferase [Bacteroidota bacterium]HHU00352.1 2-oxoglutarate dehydrogenase complex dihydrolipoyllysine-residue succinyltransferase [Bacteroidales bacterium]